MALHQALSRKKEIPAFGYRIQGSCHLCRDGSASAAARSCQRERIRISGGSAFNAVPDTIFYDDEHQNDLADKLDHLGFAYERHKDGIEVKGRAAHAMIPEEGINAIAVSASH